MVIVAVVFTNVVGRYFFHAPLRWSDEVAQFLFLWLAYLGALAALMGGRHYSFPNLIDLLPRQGSPRGEDSQRPVRAGHAGDLGVGRDQACGPASASAVTGHGSADLLRLCGAAARVLSDGAGRCLQMVARLRGGPEPGQEDCGSAAEPGSPMTPLSLRITCMDRRRKHKRHTSDFRHPDGRRFCSCFSSTCRSHSHCWADRWSPCMCRRKNLMPAAQSMIATVDSFALLSIPLFIAAGDLMNRGGITSRLVDLAHALVGHFRGVARPDRRRRSNAFRRRFGVRGRRHGSGRIRGHPADDQARLQPRFLCRADRDVRHAGHADADEHHPGHLCA